ncbi:hypothetical protein IWZ03DRAFT_212615 [Phyllosticta citriasiana]|uniref:NACHT domain-containing protein n=1 Tax=Phyllosticta citriasiana TaxID=595635 RepID=A0ABR1KMR4_9PEZI
MIYQERQLIKVIKSAWKEKHQHLTFSETSGWSLDQLERAFKSCLHHKPPGVKLFLFVDGLDEFESMDDQDTLRKEKSHREKDNDLARLLQVLLDAKDRCDVKICFASRELRTIERKLGRNPSLRIHEHTEDDMKIYTDGLLDESRGAWKRFERQHPHPREVISRRIQEKASGVFTWVYIVVSNINYDLETTRTFHEIEKKVEESPGELCGQDGLYAEALKHHVPKAHRDKGLRMLYHALDFVSSNLWGQTPNCPLDPLSLVIAEDITWFEDDLKRSVPTTDLFPMLASQEECQDLFNLGKAWLKSFTGCLLELRQNQRGENAVVFVHETVREFLEERRTIHSDQMAITESGKSLLHLESCGRVTMASFLWDFHNFMARGLDLHDSRYTLRDEKLYNQALGLALDLAVFIDTQQINRPYNDRNSKSTEERMLLFLFNDPSGQDCFLGRIQASINTIYRSQPYLDFYLECFDGLFHRSILKKSKSRKLLRVYHDDVVFPLDVGFCHRTADPNEQWKGQTIWHRFLHRQIALERSNRPKRYPKVGECVTKLVLMGADMHTRLRMMPEMKDQLKSLERPNFFGKKFFSLDSFWGTKLDRSCSPAFLIACLILYRRLQMPDSLDTESWRIPRAQTRFP